MTEQWQLKQDIEVSLASIKSLEEHLGDNNISQLSSEELLKLLADADVLIHGHHPPPPPPPPHESRQPETTNARASTDGDAPPRPSLEPLPEHHQPSRPPSDPPPNKIIFHAEAFEALVHLWSKST